MSREKGEVYPNSSVDGQRDARVRVEDRECLVRKQETQKEDTVGDTVAHRRATDRKSVV